MRHLIETLIQTRKNLLLYALHHLPKTILTIPQTLKSPPYLIITKKAANINLRLKKLIANKIAKIPASQTLNLAKSHVKLQELQGCGNEKTINQINQ